MLNNGLNLNHCKWLNSCNFAFTSPQTLVYCQLPETFIPSLAQSENYFLQCLTVSFLTSLGKKAMPSAEIVACFRGILTYFIWTGISPTYVAITTPHNDLVSWWGSQAVVNILKANFVISGFCAPPMGKCGLCSPSAEKYYWYGAREKTDSHHKQGKIRRWGHLYPQIVILLAWDYGLKVMFSTVLYLKNTWNSSSGVHNFLQT